jgi:hypothetical protein
MVRCAHVHSPCAGAAAHAKYDTSRLQQREAVRFTDFVLISGLHIHTPLCYNMLLPIKKTHD